MDRLSAWAWWTIAGGILLLSPLVAFLLAVLVEVLIGFLMQGGTPAILILAASMFGGLAVRKRWRRPRAGNLLGDQA
ncbi:MAG TPA: hypothetical protein VHT00_18615 [Stellaceae bacterium]|jgi:hypothetical protein|nr:hypothetical protein [Stellaceae bacterium]